MHLPCISKDQESASNLRHFLFQFIRNFLSFNAAKSVIHRYAHLEANLHKNFILIQKDLDN